MNKRFLIGIVLTVGLLALFLATVDFRRMVEALAEAEYVYAVPGVALYVVAVWFRTLRWQALLRHLKRVNVSRLFPVVVVGYMANNLLPMRIGELVRSYHLGERERVSKASVLATILVERALDALILLVFVAVIAVFMPVTGLARAFGDKYGVPWPILAGGLSLPFVLLFAALVLLSLYPARTMRYVLLAMRPLPERLASPLRSMAHLFLDGLAALRSPRRIALLLIMSAPIWLFEAGLFYLIGLSFGLDEAYGSAFEMAMVMILLTAIANIGSSVPAAPGGIGLFELVARETLVLLPAASVDRSVAAAYAAVVHAALLLPMIVLGQAFLWSEQVSLRRLWRGGREVVAAPPAAGAGPEAERAPAAGEDE